LSAAPKIIEMKIMQKIVQVPMAIMATTKNEI
jgi:hypothetical protein